MSKFDLFVFVFSAAMGMTHPRLAFGLLWVLACYKLAMFD